MNYETLMYQMVLFLFCVLLVNASDCYPKYQNCQDGFVSSTFEPIAFEKCSYIYINQSFTIDSSCAFNKLEPITLVHFVLKSGIYILNINTTDFEQKSSFIVKSEAVVTINGIIHFENLASFDTEEHSLLIMNALYSLEGKDFKTPENSVFEFAANISVSDNSYLIISEKSSITTDCLFVKDTSKFSIETTELLKIQSVTVSENGTFTLTKNLTTLPFAYIELKNNSTLYLKSVKTLCDFWIEGDARLIIEQFSYVEISGLFLAVDNAVLEVMDSSTLILPFGLELGYNAVLSLHNETLIGGEMGESEILFRNNSMTKVVGKKSKVLLESSFTFYDNTIFELIDQDVEITQPITFKDESLFITQNVNIYTDKNIENDILFYNKAKMEAMDMLHVETLQSKFIFSDSTQFIQTACFADFFMKKIIFTKNASLLANYSTFMTNCPVDFQMTSFSNVFISDIFISGSINETNLKVMNTANLTILQSTFVVYGNTEITGNTVLTIDNTSLFVAMNHLLLDQQCSLHITVGGQVLVGTGPSQSGVDYISLNITERVSVSLIGEQSVQSQPYFEAKTGSIVTDLNTIIADGCVNMFSSLYEIQSTSSNVFLLSNGRLGRYCDPTTFKNSSTFCELQFSNFLFGNFDYSFCPCNNYKEEKCSITLSTWIKKVNFVKNSPNVIFTFTTPLEEVYIENKDVTDITFCGDIKSISFGFGMKYTQAEYIKNYCIISDGYDTVYYNPSKIEADAITQEQLLQIGEYNFGFENTNLTIFNITNMKYHTFNFDNIQNALIYSIYGIKSVEEYTSSLIYISNNISKSLKKISITCEEGLYPNFDRTTCIPCEPNCKKCNSKSCEVCNDNYTLNNGVCFEMNMDCLYTRNDRCYLCSSGFTENGECISCDTTCKRCRGTRCDICEPFEQTLNTNSTKCVTQESALVTSNVNIIECQPEYVVNHNLCEKCGSIYTNCERCENGKCSMCSIGFYLKNGMCEPSNCLIKSANGTVCEECIVMYSLSENGYCVSTIQNCEKYINTYCVLCAIGYSVYNNTCVTYKIPNCKSQDEMGCSRCFNGFYLNNYECKKCDPKCPTCQSEDICLSCVDGTYLSKHQCIVNIKLDGKCKEYNPVGGCIICNVGYFRENMNCKKCNETCSTCLEGEKCTDCGSNYFMDTDSICHLKSEISNCTQISSKFGCLSCEAGFFVEDRKCQNCSSNCTMCTSLDQCQSCNDEYVLIDNKCYAKSDIMRCIEVKQSQCTKCEFWYTPRHKGTYCTKKAVWWVIVLCLLVFLVLSIALLILVYLSFGWMYAKRVEKKQEIQCCVFDIESSNINFKHKITRGVLSNRKCIEFDDYNTVKINEEHRELVCICNTNKESMKIQLTSVDTDSRYFFRTNPEVITLRSRHACEFELFIKPTCSCRIDTNVLVSCKNMKSGTEKMRTLKIKVYSELSTRLDFSEIIENKKIGEGSFGVVYLGYFRGNKVAVKHMRNRNTEQKAMQAEFDKEVTMLDKFRCNYIIHFFGACYTSSHICMVTEFAPCGSLGDVVKNKVEVRLCVRLKALADASHGISYLHSNGILHRDIKPDNILLFTLDDSSIIVSKLTDFGSSRNVNLLMTDMTFTAGIGTPKYMAPEILKKAKYGKPADIYSLGITIYEIVLLRDVYGIEYKYPWNIANAVVSGKRPSVNEMTPTLARVVENCWTQAEYERWDIDKVASELERINIGC
ncbi:protein serine/threonine kinase, putative [Entamoeba invadens IP1]|uniref:Protein serine/threonine kinase, putative n=1 Tax=Entamoeba invadens IP1 TaxID=370355 RepID=A0A0A1UEM3_ENTIV|nr:protein serine/threonine kinase, putative [Entamoeba invadens IP1]ELP95026.1 protein serine/threonine kinase, putative [Entamoeba invadens IP1]|eukprot:XP_004261797.1 protein serine/threonine kinase, putative [Entamoeba invadens IP1]